MGLRIGYLTDIHLRKEVKGVSSIKARRCREMVDLLPEVLARMERESPDLIVCTGDVVDLPAEEGVMQDLRFSRQLFEDCAAPHVILPGNHDPIPEVFYRVFGRPRRTMVANGCRLVSFHEDACLEDEESCRRNDASLREMEALLLGNHDPFEITILLQHYLVYPDKNHGYPHNYQNADDIRSIMERSNQKILSISGHYHPGIPLTAHNGISYFGGRAFCQPPHPYYLIDASEKGVFIEEFETGKAGPSKEFGSS